MMDPGSPVRDPSEFVGRSGVVRRICSRIGADRPQSVAVIGGAKSGKTSLLAYLSHESMKRRLLQDAERYEFVAACSACQSSVDPEEFLHSLARLLSPVRDSERNPYERVRKRIEELHASGKRIVVFLDDFHAVTSNERYPLEFFSFLRSLANNFNVAYVTTSFLELQKLCVAKDVEESPFFNIFTNLTLGMLTAAEAQKLAATVTGAGEGDARRFAAWCGGSPYAIKIAAKSLAAAAPASFSDSDLEEALLPGLAPFYTQVVSILPPSAARPLQAVARGKPPAHHDIHLLASLVKQGFLEERGETLESHSPAFAAFLRTSLSARMLQGSP